MNDADRAKQYMAEHGMTKGDLVEADGRVCMMGAVLKVLDMTWIPGISDFDEMAEETYSTLNKLPVTKAMAKVIGEQYPELFNDENGSIIAHQAMPSQWIGYFNDHKETTQEMAERVFEKASAWLDEQV